MVNKNTKRSRDLLASAKQVLTEAPKSFTVKPWRDIMQAHTPAMTVAVSVNAFGRRATDRLAAEALMMVQGEATMPAANAKERANALKQAEERAAARGILRPEHLPEELRDPPDEEHPHEGEERRRNSAFGAFAAHQLARGVDSARAGMVESSFHQPTSLDTPMEATKTKQELDAEKVQAKIAEKAEKKRLQDEARAVAQAKKAEEAAAKAAIKAAEKAKRDAEKQAAAEARAAEQAAKPPRERTYEGSMLALSDRVKQGTYVKGVNGQLRSNDDVAVALESIPAKKMVAFLLGVLGLPENPYAALNYGQQSMNLRNRLRGALRKGVEVHGTKLTIDAVKTARDEGGWAEAEKVEELATA